MQEVRGKAWSEYWTDSAQDRSLFAVIAKVYRRFIISPAVRYYFHRYFSDQPGRVYLHAGCGSGESDNRIHFQQATFILMDISPEALALARWKTKLHKVHFVCGDIFNPPFKAESIDGIWNLGVMEHFYEKELVQIFRAMSRLLKQGGRCLIFWPPRYGLSVVVLTSFLFLVNKLRKQPLVLYPDEVSRFRSEQWINRLTSQTGLETTNTHFGIRDLFTYVVMVAVRRFQQSD